jgi:N6-L-threonylcarbamoyladenine synthase
MSRSSGDVLRGPLLAVETSCDDTCAAVLDPSGRVLSSVVSSQEIHARFQGIVPELASREHIRLLVPVVHEALERAGVGVADLGAVAATSGPGLIGSLLVGLSFAKGLAQGRQIPLVAVNHIEAHLMAILAEERVEPPLVGLVISGGHTELLAVPEWDRWELLGATRDDAAGEAFDKVAKMLGLGFPGGPVVDRTAREGSPEAYAFPRAMLDMDRRGLDFSFSGLKTAVKLFLEERGWPEEPRDPQERRAFLADVAASFQEAVVDVLAIKLAEASRRTGWRRLVVCGGVACNSALRRRLREEAEREGWELHLPSPPLCADNAVMVGMSALHHLRKGEASSLEVPAVPSLEDWDGRYRRIPAPAG